ncbi:MAG TPA: heavy metal translocating P-type ATPase [Streptosporangiaceae bacterium]|jgi:cation-transporting P-type ATPase A/B/Cu+-exporting ATPase
MTAVAPETTQGVQVELVIGGMTCAACAARVQAKLNKVTGVTASVNLSTERAYVSAPATVSAPDLIGVVEAAGYTAELARPAAQAGPEQDEAAVRRLRRRLTLALVFFVPLTDVSLMLSIFPWTRFPGWQWLLVALAVPVATWAAWPFHAAALRQARHLSSSMDTLVSLGILAACGWSAYAMFVLDRGRSGLSGLQNLLHGSGGGIYLEVAASVTTFLLAGRLYEARARRTAGQAMRELAAAGARDVCVLDDDGTERSVPAALLRAGQRFVVRPGERIAADGEVLSGQSAVDRSTMTGESVPVDAAPGDTVTGGTIVLTGRLVVRADKVGADTQLAHMITMVEQAQAGKAGIQRLADRVCAVFVPSVLACSALTLAGWLLAGSPAGHAVSAALAVLIIACPCALGLATPAALIVASGQGARMGIFIKGYQALESSSAIDTVVLDKTGTVTTGQMTVAAVRTLPGVGRAGLLRLAGSVEQASEHAVAAAITALARSESALLVTAYGFEALPGLGARGVVDGREIMVGRSRLFGDRGVTVPAELAAWCRAREEDGCTTVLAAWDDAVRGAFAVTDTVKPSAAAAVARMRAMGLRPVLLTGDNAATARAVGEVVGIGEVVSEALPAAKARVVREWQEAGRSVAMVGDGVNDGPVLAAARLGLALGSGTDVAIVAADMILLRDDLNAVPEAIALARAAFRAIRANLAWAFCYNMLAIPLAALGFLNPLVAAATMTLSSVFVVWNSLRLRRFAGRRR